jgi:2-(1,2-epoxy-1,2-dihydrophenyl)acetyl-CoA isomerase
MADSDGDDHDHVRIERAEAVGRLVMDRPETNNAMHRSMAAELAEAAVALVTDEAIRCVVVTGTDGTFNTGADLTALDADASDESHLRYVARELHAAVSALARAPKPVVCAVNGVAAGGGIGLALCGDVVLAAGSSRFAFAYPRIGLSIDGGSSFFLPRLVGLRRAQEIAFRDEPIEAPEAEEIGLVTEAIPDGGFEEAVATEAERLASGPTRAYAETKALVRSSFETGLDEQLSREAARLAGLTRTDDYARGIEGFLADETPAFEGE